MKRSLVVGVACCINLVACTAGRSEAPSGADHGPSRQAEAAAIQGGAAEKTAAPTDEAAGLAATVAARKLVRTGAITVEVDSFGGAAEAVIRLAESLGGYVADSRMSHEGANRRRGTLTIKVPAERFAGALADLEKLGRVVEQNVQTQDVTKAYTDVETRLRIKRETAERLRAILAQRAAKLSEILEVERELARVTEEVEQLEGEKRYYDQIVAFSSITVTLREPPATFDNALSPIKEALSESTRVLSVSIAAGIYVSVFLAPWIIALWVLWRLVRARRRRRSTPPEQTAAE